MMRTTERLVLLVVIMVVMIMASGQAEAALTATLSASPPTISEGGYTNLTLTLNYSPMSYGYTTQAYYYNQGYDYFREFFNGNGMIAGFSGSINPGDGQGSLAVGGSPNSAHYQTTRTAQYLNPGTWTAGVSGSATLLDYTNYERYHYYNGWYQTGGGLYGSRTSGAGINASTQVQVSNLAPWITSLTWMPSVLVGETMAFSAAANDPGGVGTTETMTFAYDFDQDGLYDDYSQSGKVLNSSGTYSFSTAGTYTVGVKITDGLGGTGYSSFDVNVFNPAPEPSSVPEPTTLLVWSGLGAIGTVMAARKKRQAA